MSKNTERDRLEQEIVDFAATLPRTTLHCHDEGRLDHWFGLWMKLSKHIERSGDTEIGIAVLREYVYWEEHFRLLAESKSLPEDCRQIAEEAAGSLDACIKWIVGPYEA